MSVYKYLLTPVLQSDTERATRKSALPAGRRRAAVVVCKARTRLQRPTLHFTTPLLSSLFLPNRSRRHCERQRPRPSPPNKSRFLRERNGEPHRADRRKIL